MNADDKNRTGHDHDTVDLHPALLDAAALAPLSTSAQIRAELAGQTHRGLVRPNNEDHFLAVRFGRSFEVVCSNLTADEIPYAVAEQGYGMLVADGMGGSAAGETASKLAITTLLDLVLSTPDWMLRTGDREVRTVMHRMAQRYRDVDAALAETARGDPELEGMGTTMTLACALGTQVVLAHVGDSRVYLLRDGKLTRMTRDHTVAQSLADRGLLCPEDVARHRLRSVLTQCLGSGCLMRPEIRFVTIAPGDQLLLCTDGLTEMVKEAAIESILREPRAVVETCQVLIEQALQNGGKDNVTVVLARFEEATKSA
jgi:protein phosphatase